MKYIELRQKIKSDIFSLQDLKNSHFKVYPYQLSEWTAKNLLIKLKNGVYLFADKKDDITKEVIAFNIYQPSYVSMEWVLSKYNLIPEMVYHVTSITNKATRKLENDFGVFIYRHVKKELFFGYEKVKKDNQVFLLATPEKALFDYLYLNASKIKNKDDVNELRLNKSNLKKIKINKLREYSQFVDSKCNMEHILKLIFN